uniref:Permease n=1 Tax=Strongyloides venezuelensis TaxID=75913 RepID=A0A0K0G066_STRVS
MDIDLGFFHLIGIFQVENVGTTTFITLPNAIPIILAAGVLVSQYVTNYGELPEEEYQTYEKLLNNKISDEIRKKGSSYSYFTIASFMIVAAIIIILSILISIRLKGNRSNMT